MARSSTMWLRALSGAAVASIVLTATPSAHAQRYGAPVHRGEYRGGHSNSYNAHRTSVQISGRHFTIDLRRNITYQLECIFRKLGYRAHRRGSSLYVNIGDCPPSISWSPCDYDLNIRRDGCYLVVCPVKKVSYAGPSRRVGPYYPPPRHRSGSWSLRLKPWPRTWSSCSSW